MKHYRVKLEYDGRSHVQYMTPSDFKSLQKKVKSKKSGYTKVSRTDRKTYDFPSTKK